MKQVVRESATDMDASGHTGLRLPKSGTCPRNHVVPDLTVAPAHRDLFPGVAEPWMPCDGVAMVVEVTSGRADRDRHAKRHCYAMGGIPLSVLVDRERGSVTLFGDPQGDDCREAVTHPFGKEMRLPAPFSFGPGHVQVRLIRTGRLTGRQTSRAGGRVRSLVGLPRNVRAPQGRVVGNAYLGRPTGQCHRKQTAGAFAAPGKGETVV